MAQIEQPKVVNRISSELERQGISQADFTAAIGKNPESVRRWCKNDNQPTIRTLYKIAKYLKVEAVDLLLPMSEVFPEEEKEGSE